MEAKPSGQTITVAVVEDEPLLRDLLRVALQQHAGLEVVGVFSQAEQTLRHLPRLQPQVALLGLASSTVENQLNQIYQELGLGEEHTDFNPRVRAALLYLVESQTVVNPETPPRRA